MVDRTERAQKATVWPVSAQACAGVRTDLRGASLLPTTLKCWSSHWRPDLPVVGVVPSFDLKVAHRSAEDGTRTKVEDVSKAEANGRLTGGMNLGAVANRWSSCHHPKESRG